MSTATTLLTRIGGVYRQHLTTRPKLFVLKLSAKLVPALIQYRTI
jgi:hypothetical protein